jgi:hypothetical protein
MSDQFIFFHQLAKAAEGFAAVADLMFLIGF